LALIKTTINVYMNKKKILWCAAGLALFLAIGIASLSYYLWQSASTSKATANETATQQNEDEPGPKPEERPTPIYPSIKGINVKFNDSPYAGIDESISYRVFEIPNGSNGSIYLSAAYLDQEKWGDDREDDTSMVFRLADLNAAFDEDAVYDIMTTRTWDSVRLHIGSFTQDACYNLSMVYTFRNQKIFAIVPKGDFDFTKTGCPLAADEAPKGTEDFCDYRSKCLKQYFDQPEHRKELIEDWIEKIANLPIE
jgi:hypothetical protein